MTFGVEKPSVEGTCLVGAPVFRNSPLASRIVSPNFFSLSVGQAERDIGLYPRFLKCTRQQEDGVQAQMV